MPSFTTSDNVELYFDDEGDGPALLCLSGLTRDSRDFDYALSSLGGLRVIRMDYRGRGKSAWADWRSYTIEREARDALELLDHLGLAHAAILGSSRGGLIAMAIAATQKHRLSGACLVDIGPVLEPGGLEVIKDFVGKRPVWKTLEEAAKARSSVMAGFAKVPQSRWDEEVAKFYTEEEEGLVLSYDPDLRRSVLEAGTQPVPDLWPLFYALEGLPTAAIRGANSDLFSHATLMEMVRRRPDMHWAAVADRGHIPFLDEPEAVEVLEQFTTELKSA